MSQNLMLGILFSKDKEDLDYSVRHALVVGGSGEVPHAPGWRRDDWYKASAWTDAPLRVLVAARDTEMLQAFFDSYKRHKGNAQTMLFALTSLVRDAPSMYDWLMAHGGFAHLSPVAPAALSCRDKMYETLIEHHVKTGTTQAWDQWLRRYLTPAHAFKFLAWPHGGRSAGHTAASGRRDPLQCAKVAKSRARMACGLANP